MTLGATDDVRNLPLSQRFCRPSGALGPWCDPSHGFTPVAPPRASSGGTLRSTPSFAKATEDYPLRIHPRLYSRGFLRRRVKTKARLRRAFASLASLKRGRSGPKWLRPRRRVMIFCQQNHGSTGSPREAFGKKLVCLH